MHWTEVAWRLFTSRFCFKVVQWSLNCFDAHMVPVIVPYMGSHQLTVFQSQARLCMGAHTRTHALQPMHPARSLGNSLFTLSPFRNAYAHITLHIQPLDQLWPLPDPASRLHCCPTLSMQGLGRPLRHFEAVSCQSWEASLVGPCPPLSTIAY
jgi:hypothetical protein